MGKFEKHFQIHIQENIKNVDNSKRSASKDHSKKKGYKKWWADKKQRLLGSEEYLF